MAIIAFNADYFRAIPIEDRIGLKEQVPDFSQLQSNIAKAKVAIMEVGKYYETRT